MPLQSTKRTLRFCMRRLLRQKKLENITVSEICQKAEIGRRTFYRYYADKYALFEDTLTQEFLNKLDFSDAPDTYEVYIRMATYMYEDQEFFTRAISVKGQNGFWELMSDFLYQYIYNLVSADPYIDRAKEFYIRKDSEIFLHHLYEWLMGGCKTTPDELIQYIRMCDAIHGKWQYQIATGKEPDKYSLDRIKNNEW